MTVFSKRTCGDEVSNQVNILSFIDSLYTKSI